MLKKMNALFINHPASVNESYWEHFGVAFGFARTLLLAGFAALVHALIPGLFEKTAGRLVRELNERLSSR